MFDKVESSIPEIWTDHNVVSSYNTIFGMGEKEGASFLDKQHETNSIPQCMCEPLNGLR